MIIIKKTYSDKSLNYKMRIQISVLEILYALGNYCIFYRDNPLYIKQKDEFVYIRRSIQYTDENFYKNIGLKEVTDYLGLSEKYFSRYFKERTGEGYHQYLNNVRLHHAVRQLLNGQTSVLQCALDNGFPNVKSFIECFKQNYGCTPGKYRKYIQRKLDDDI